MKTQIRNHFFLTAISLAMSVTSSLATTSTWSGATSSDWTLAGNWTANPPAYGSTQTGRLNVQSTRAAVYDPVGQGAGNITTTFTGADSGQERGLVVGSITPGTLNIMSGTLMIKGGSVVGTNPIVANSISGTIAISGGTLDLSTHTLNFVLVLTGNTGVVGTLAMTDGSFIANETNLFNNNNNVGTSILDLSGGTFTVKGVTRGAVTGSATSTIKLNGGTMQPRISNASFLPALFNTTVLVQAGGAKFDTQGFNITVGAALTHDSALGATMDGGLTKSGAGTLTLSGANTYTGNTTVNGGTLSLGTASLADGATLAVAVGSVVNLNFTGSDTIDKLFIDGVQVAAGTYGSTSSGADHPDNLHFSGSGRLTVSNGPVDGGYDNWATGRGLTDLNKARSLDPDGDGASNFVEYAFDGDPLSGTRSGKRVTKIASVGGADVLTLTLPVRTTASFQGGSAASGDGVTYTLQASIDLSVWDQIPVSETPAMGTGSLPTLSPGYSYRTFYVPGSDPALNTKIFMRAIITETR